MSFTCTNILARCVIQSILAVLNKAQIGIHHVIRTYCHGCQGLLSMRNTFVVCCSSSMTPRSLSKVGLKLTRLDYKLNSNSCQSKGERCSTSNNFKGEQSRRMILTLLECCFVVVMAGEASTNRTLLCQVFGRIPIR